MEPIQFLAPLAPGFVLGGHLTKSARRQAWPKAREAEAARARANASQRED